MMKPSVGRIVHYVWDQDCYAAIITAVAPDGRVQLLPFSSSEWANIAIVGVPFRYLVRQDDEHALGTWHEPERV